ncbi:MAG: hypothetical protein ACYCQK_11195 [Acidiferrobacteraceae bacterium]
MKEVVQEVLKLGKLSRKRRVGSVAAGKFRTVEGRGSSNESLGRVGGLEFEERRSIRVSDDALGQDGKGCLSKLLIEGEDRRVKMGGKGGI